MTDQPLTSSPNELHTISAMSTEESKDEGLDSPAQFRAAEYVRMSTEHQQYSTENQADKIREYAAHRGIKIVKTYADSGKSGLSIGGRLALQQLIKDVECKQPANTG